MKYVPFLQCVVRRTRTIEKSQYFYCDVRSLVFACPAEKRQKKESSKRQRGRKTFWLACTSDPRANDGTHLCQLALAFELN